MDWLLTMAERAWRNQDKVAVSPSYLLLCPTLQHVLAALRCAARSFKYDGDQIDQLKDAGEEDGL